MMSHPVYSQLVIRGCLWLCRLVHCGWPSRSTRSPRRPAAPGPLPSKRQCSTEPQPCEGRTPRPRCAACEPDAHPPQGRPPRRPEPMPPTHRRPCAIDTSLPVCPPGDGDAQGGLGLGNRRANGPPSGGPGRQGSGRSGQGDGLEPHGTLCPGPPAAVDRLVRVWAGLAEGWGRRATARVGGRPAPGPVGVGGSRRAAPGVFSRRALPRASPTVATRGVVGGPA
jgi:hypothetical protein